MRKRGFDITGVKFGYWTAVKFHSKNKFGHHIWEVRCVCGTVSYKAKNLLLKKGRASKSCGCMKAKLISQKTTKHGYFGTRVYNAFHAMHNRCKNINKRNARYKGVKICERWGTFENFLEDMGEPPTKKHTLDRIDNSRGYFKENCRWATATEQARNKDRSKRYTFKGKTLCLVEWNELLGYKKNSSLISGRLRRGWSVADAIGTKPVKGANQFKCP